MENNNFDRRIRERLQGLEGKYQAGDWEKMEQKLDAEFNPATEMEDVLLDGMAYGSLKDLHVEYNPSHWNLMESKLDGAGALRKKIYRYKIVELALLLLAIFTVLQLIPTKKQQTTVTQKIADTTPLQEDNTSEFGLNLSEDKMLEESAPEKLNAQSDQSDDQQNIEKPSSNNSAESAAETKKTTPAQNIVSEIKKVENTNQASTPTENQINLTKLLFEDKVTALADDESSSVHLEENDAQLSLSNRFFTNKQEKQDDFSELFPIVLYDPEPLGFLGQPELPDCVLCKPGKSPIKISLGMFVGPDADYVLTPYDEKFEKEEFGQLALGYSGGFTLGFKYNKWELETGAAYASTSYGSRNILEISGSFAQGGYVQQGLAGAQLDILRVPLNLRYNFLDKKKWNYYVVTGGSVNMTVETLYEYTTENVGGRFNPDASRSADIQNATPYDGIFEGGSFLENTFLTANLGLGVERYFSSRMSVFFQPTYSHQLSKGLGPQSDKINSLSIMTGARVTLKKKKKQ